MKILSIGFHPYFIFLARTYIIINVWAVYWIMRKYCREIRLFESLYNLFCELLLKNRSQVLLQSIRMSKIISLKLRSVSYKYKFSNLNWVKVIRVMFPLRRIERICE